MPTIAKRPQQCQSATVCLVRCWLATSCSDMSALSYIHINRRLAGDVKKLQQAQENQQRWARQMNRQLEGSNTSSLPLHRQLCRIIACTTLAGCVLLRMRSHAKCQWYWSRMRSSSHAYDPNCGAGVKAERRSAVEEAQRLQHAVDAVVSELHVTRRLLIPAASNIQGTVLGVSPCNERSFRPSFRQASCILQLSGTRQDERTSLRCGAALPFSVMDIYESLSGAPAGRGDGVHCGTIISQSMRSVHGAQHRAGRLTHGGPAASAPDGRTRALRSLRSVLLS